MSRSLNKLEVVLDLDSTLIYGLDSDYDAQKLILHLIMQEMVREDEKGQQYCVDVHETEYHPKRYTFERPGLQTFLRELSKFATISVFTARPKPSALFAVNLIDPTRAYISQVFSQEAMTAFKVSRGRVIMVKDLDNMWSTWDPARTLVIDDAWDHYGCKQPCNFLPIRPWGFDGLLYNLDQHACGESETFPQHVRSFVQDQYLMQDILPLLREINQLQDVRAVVVNMQACKHYEQRLQRMVGNVEGHLGEVGRDSNTSYINILRQTIDNFRSYQRYCCNVESGGGGGGHVSSREMSIEEKLRFVQEIL